MGIGQCDAPNKPTTTSGSISLSANYTTIYATASHGANSTVISIVGGTTPYSISISSGSIAAGVNAGYFLNSSSTQVSSLSGISTSSVTFYAYNTVATTQTVTLAVTDSSSPSLTQYITLTVSP